VRDNGEREEEGRCSNVRERMTKIHYPNFLLTFYIDKTSATKIYCSGNLTSFSWKERICVGYVGNHFNVKITEF
jgi:hypothetical protein